MPRIDEFNGLDAIEQLRRVAEALHDLAKPRDEFVAALSDVPPKPAAMGQILRINQGREGSAP